MSLSKSVLAQGKRLLMEAALKLNASTRSLNALSLRELAREAGLNPNTFYRHFKDFDELGMAIIEEMTKQIRQPLRDLRRRAAESVAPAGTQLESWEDNPRLNLAKATQVNQATVKLFFDYVAANPNAFILGIRELHGASPVLRKALRQVMEDFAQDMADDIEELRLMPALERSHLYDISETISREMFQLSMDYIEQPERREQICLKAEKMITALIMGSAVLHGHGPTLMQAL
ncbi:MAG: TetR family transcriptional regulator [Pseudomonadales bacterium]|uniref:TetR family transcriptional regulator n=1 Tax=unclassified Ketobacter TaxID=2639109 RepID=UPI000C946F44|nr:MULTISPECIES: TetR family transcriptional regulator [unclassified Ketobacter]MAA59142.1 TetR family transcriptional regulator [Pseudomonadales bacterium]HAG93084.1 TetR family transcriptional regulator [Gammaproteobacteria bacterium]MAQ23734.1 TetR family transcriptional regulator [Pseudomonadales bacterium]MCK5789311.1 TetR family transcriptional regulator [Ketobacter sp.]RLT87888.1 MAG: TetR family transcriptional regulator [Ketobacter sp. GenoA1]|tara:strand:+ start:11050 stop:11748 length:699 start_codon:yes stop_codon:yes gene_type:complete